MKPFVWFVAGLAFGEFVLRWLVHAVYIGLIITLLLRIHSLS